MESKIEVQFSCIICLETAKNALETSCCHQICCQECKLHLPKPYICPACRAPNVDFIISHCLRRIIENLTGVKSDAIVVKQEKNGDFSLTKNKDGANIFTSIDDAHLMKKMIYCGRNVGQKGYFNPCGTCDGRCGPSNGCQCHACFELQSKFNVKCNKLGKKVHFSFDTFHDKKLKYYCGLIRDNLDCNSCDSRCGPNNGCQCSACAELL